MAPSRGEHPRTPRPGEESGRKPEQEADAQNIEIGELDATALQKLKEHWQGTRRYKQPGARALIRRIEARLRQLEKEQLAAPQHKEQALPEAGTPPEVPTVPETFEMPAGPDEEAAHIPEPADKSLPTVSPQTPSRPQTSLPTEHAESTPEHVDEISAGAEETSAGEAEQPAPSVEQEGARASEPSTLEERIAAAEARYNRSVFGLPAEASDNELRQRMGETRMRRLGLPEHADPEYIAQAEEQWQREGAALPEITDPSDEGQLAPYYSHFHVEPGTGYEAIQQAMVAARLEREGFPASFAAEAPSAVAQSGERAGGAPEGPDLQSGEESEHAPTPEPVRTEEGATTDRRKLWSDMFDFATPATLSEWLVADREKLTQREQSLAEKRNRGEEIFDWEERILEEERAKFLALIDAARRKGVDVSEYEAPTTSPEVLGSARQEQEGGTEREAEQTPSQVVSHPETASVTPTVPERTEGETSDTMLPRLIDGALSGAGIRERLGSRKERQVLERYEKEAARREVTEEEQRAVWGALTAIYGRRIERSDDPEAAQAAADSYRGFLRQGGMPASAEKNILMLDALSRHHSPEEALRLFHDIQDATVSVAQVTEGTEGVVRNQFSDAIGEAWLAKLKQQIKTAEQQETRAHPDPEAFGRLQGIVESPPLPETLSDRLQAATEMFEMLQHRRPERPETERTAEPERTTTLQAHRSAYAGGLQSQSRIFGRTSPEELGRLRTEYQTAIQEEVAAKIREITTTLGRTPDGQPISPDVQSEVQAALVDALLKNRFEEETALKESMRSSAEKSAASAFKEFWKKHPKARIAIGLALAGATTASAAHGNILAAGIFQSMRSVVSGASMTMTTEAIWEKSRERWGGTKKLTRTDVAGLSDEELERRIAAHTVASANFEPDYYEKRLGRGLTVEMLTDEYRRRKDSTLTAEIRQMREAGRTTDEIAQALVHHSLNAEISHHAALENRKEANRKAAVTKWTVAIGTGVIAGALTGALGAGRLARAAEAATAREAAGHAGGAAKQGMLERLADAGDQPGTAQAATHGAEHAGNAAENAHDAARSEAESLLTRSEIPADRPSFEPAEPSSIGGGAADVRGAEAGSLASSEAREQVAATQEAGAGTAQTAETTTKAAEAYAGQMKDAVIQKGEGIEHALRRQLEAMPEKFGFHGDTADTASVHEWSGGEAHRVALREGFASLDGSETRVAFDADHPARFMLNADGHVSSTDAETFAYNTPSLGQAEPHLAQAAGSASAEAASSVATQIGERAAAATTESIADMTTLKDISPQEFGIDPDIKVAAPEGIQEKLDAYGVRFDGREIHIGRQTFTLDAAGEAGLDEPPRTYFTFGEQASNEVNLSIEHGNLNLRVCAVNGQEGALEIGPGGKIIGMDGIATADGTPVDQLVNGEAFAEARPTGAVVDHGETLDQALKKSAESSITLSKHGREALTNFRATVEDMGKYNRGAMIGIRRALVDLPARDVLTKSGFIEEVIDQQQGGTHDVAVRYTKALAKLFRALPKNKIRTDETIGSVLNRLASSLDHEQASIG